MSVDRLSEPGWRPATYWPPLPSDRDLIGRIRGARRREALRDALASGDLTGIDPSVLREALSVEERRALLQAHPRLALGEYLPELEDADLPEGEVEIARLYLASGIGNTISIRARRSGPKMLLRAVDDSKTASQSHPTGSSARSATTSYCTPSKRSSGKDLSPTEKSSGHANSKAK